MAWTNTAISDAREQIDIEAACAGCFLNERTGGVCPMAIDIYRLEVLHATVIAEVLTATPFVELVRREVAPAVETSQTLALPPGATDRIFNDHEREVDYVQARSER